MDGLINDRDGHLGKKESYSRSRFLSQKSKIILLTPAIRSVTFFTNIANKRIIINSLVPL